MLLNSQKNITKNSPPRNFLTNYIDEQLRMYAEPQRKGTPRGESIGMGQKKFHACLLSLSNTMQKDIAEKVGVGYGLVRKWGTEKEFQKAKARLLKQFVEIFEDVILDHITDNLRAYRKYFKASDPTLQPRLEFIENTMLIVNPLVIDQLVERLGDMHPIHKKLAWFQTVNREGYEGYLKSAAKQFLECFIYVSVMQNVLYYRIQKTKPFQKRGQVSRHDVTLYERIIWIEMMLIEEGIANDTFPKKGFKLVSILGTLFSHIRQFHGLISGDAFKQILIERHKDDDE